MMDIRETSTVVMLFDMERSRQVPAGALTGGSRMGDSVF